ncbi:glycoside hydrolase family 43 protein [Metabacillus niabensis]|uniref:Alpha-N-arabinofuranosidase n=1 Tax=Metabacillus niabensis TaxID=324854 RepID=A0ABT9Z1Q0_9BACI|nr:glycoside hydrolase family 43 protein [Metabacillus niabensis]MDQ0226168.1 alpha-N-arabinofuranosidase [Metabacillus niabensis]
MKYLNPILPGFYPDPSIVKVGEDDFYLVTSSFEYFPAIPIFHSKDLLNWKQIGSVLTRDSQVNLRNSRSSGGLYAPTLRYDNGTFYLISTDVSGTGNFYVTATDPQGPWSDPIKIPYGNIDPSLMFDDDGKVYVTVQNGAGYESHIIQYEINIQTGEALTSPVVISNGDGGQWTEAPHLYKIRGIYYLLCACGGTGEDHRAIISKSSQPYGSFEMLNTPILTHNQMNDHPIQNIGHADFVEDSNGNWWAVFLGTRPVNQKYTILGRETFLAPINWTEDGWPMIDNNEGIVNGVMETTNLTGNYKLEEFFLDKDDFEQDRLDLTWFHLRAKCEKNYSLTDRKGWLSLHGGPDNLSDEKGTPTFICKPQKHIKMELSALLEFEPENDGEEAGLSVRLNENAHYEIAVKQVNGERVVVALKTIQGHTEEMTRSLLQNKRIKLSIMSDDEDYHFRFAEEGEEWKCLGKSQLASLSKEENGGYGSVFTGVCLGLYATGNGKASSTPAFFDWVQYKGDNEISHLLASELVKKG